jgi:hypothetical protein
VTPTAFKARQERIAHYTRDAVTLPSGFLAEFGIVSNSTEKESPFGANLANTPIDELRRCLLRAFAINATADTAKPSMRSILSRRNMPSPH